MEHAARPSRDGGFTVIEAMVAVTLLAIAVMLTIQPVMNSLRQVADSRLLGVAQNLAQAEIESLRALDYEDIGLPGRTPSGVLEEYRVVEIEGREYSIRVEVWYAGSLTGLDVVPQGGDGVEGSWDPGVDYKAVRVTVVAEGRERDPVIMETIVAPRSIGAHEAIANARIYVAAHEPFAPSDLLLPSLKVVAPPAAPIHSTLRASEVVFPAIPPGTYSVQLNVADGWLIHPDDVINGIDQLVLVPGALSQTTIRVYRPATLEVTVVDDTTGQPVASPRITLRNTVTGVATAYDPGVVSIDGLVPDAYDIGVAASGYEVWTATSVNIPAGYPNPLHEITVRLAPNAPTTTTMPGTTTTVPGATTTTTVPAGSIEVTFTVEDSTGRRIAGATVTVGAFTATTNAEGRAYLNLAGGWYNAVGSTSWGHGSDSDWFDPDDDDQISLDLTRPRGKGLMALRGGNNAEFLYRSRGSGTWIVMPSNQGGEASFVGSSGSYDVAKRCLTNGNVVDQRTVSISPNRNRSTNLATSCP
ncbi:MAG: hypothetical protein WEE36_01620 [Acidimicrobiia bacterium]